MRPAFDAAGRGTRVAANMRAYRARKKEASFTLAASLLLGQPGGGTLAAWRALLDQYEGKPDSPLRIGPRVVRSLDEVTPERRPWNASGRLDAMVHQGWLRMVALRGQQG